METAPVTIVHLRIENVLGIETMDLDPGPQTVLEGENGAGKSSVLEAIKAAFEGKGFRPRTVRDDAEEGRVVLLLSDGTEITQRFTADGKAKPPSVKLGRAQITSPRDYLAGLLSRYQLDPLSFLAKRPAEQATELLSLVDLEVPQEKWVEWSGGELLPQVSYADHPLAVLAKLEAFLTERRKGFNALTKDRETLSKDQAAQVPAGFDPEAVRGTSGRELAERLAEASDENRTLERKRRELDTRDAEITRLEVQVAELKEQRALAAADIAGQELVDLAPLEEAVASREEQLAALKHHDDACAFAEEAEQNRKEAAVLTGLIDNLRALPSELLKGTEMPVEGMDVGADGKLTIHGQALDQLSDGEKLILVLQVAAAQSGEVKILCADGLERLDSKHRAAFLAAAQRHGFQLFATEVADTSLTVSTGETADPIAEEVFA